MLPVAIEKSVGLDGPLVRDKSHVSNNNEEVPAHDVHNGSLSRYLPLSRISAEVQKPVSGATKLRKMLSETNELVVCPGVYDGLSARTAIELSFNAMYMVCGLRIVQYSTL